MAASPEEAMAKMIASLKEKSGKSIEQWVSLVEKSKKAKHGEIVSWLKAEHGVTHGYANLIAHHALKSDAVSVTAGARISSKHNMPAQKPPSGRFTIG